MKAKLTRKDLWGYSILSIPYGQAQSLLNCIECIGYNSGIYGWNYDAYYFEGILICTGYRSLPKGDIPYSQEIANKYNTKAAKRKTSAARGKLLSQMIEELKNAASH